MVICARPNENVRVLAPILAAFVFLGFADADETTFRDVQFASAKGELANASVTFSDDTKAIVIHVSDGPLVNIPYDHVDSLSYEYTKKHRLKPALAVGIFSPGTGMIIALTKAKNHWLDIDFHDQDAAKAVVLRLSKRDYQKVCDAAKIHTGKDVSLAGKTTTQAIQGKIKD